MIRNSIACVVNIQNQHEFQHLKKKKKYYDQFSTIPFWNLSDIVIVSNNVNPSVPLTPFHSLSFSLPLSLAYFLLF